MSLDQLGSVDGGLPRAVNGRVVAAGSSERRRGGPLVTPGCTSPSQGVSEECEQATKFRCEPLRAARAQMRPPRFPSARPRDLILKVIHQSL